MSRSQYPKELQLTPEYVEAIRRGIAAELAEVEQQLVTWAIVRFKEHGPLDARAAALWDMADWIRNRPAKS